MDTVAQELSAAATGPAPPPGLLGQLLELYQAGGPVVGILALLSVLGLAIVIAKLWQFHNARIYDRRTADYALAAYRRGQVDEALSLARSSPSPVAVAVALVIAGEKRGVPAAAIREEVIRYGLAALEELRSWLKPLEVIASLAPLLGLFGTVMGMISAFQQLEQAGSRVDPSVLSGGIWEALLTTAVGLAVAIPAVAALNWLERYVERLAFQLDDVVTAMFTVDLTGHESHRARSAAAPVQPQAAAAGA
jgi:biopolymer transport protein ExbB